jgi:Protein of unknown function (DUF4240)
MRASVVLSAAALVAVLFVFVSGRGEGSSGPSLPGAAVQQAPAPALSPQPTPTTAPRETSKTASARTEDSAFWSLVDDTRGAAGKDTARQSELLRERLEQLSPREIVAFERTRDRLDRRAYTWSLWGAALVIEDGCSDDCFRDFRAYVISLGRGTYERALRNPDSLASIVQDAESGDWENADDVAPDAYSSVTGNDFPFEVSDISGRPAGEPINERSLRARYPRLAARFR